MKKWKRAAAILGVVLLLALFCLPMIFAFGTDEDSAGRFRASIGLVILVPVLLYAMMLIYRVLNKRDNKKETGMIKNVIFDVGNVLIDYDWEAYLDSFGFPKEERDAMAVTIFNSKLWNERDRGAKTDAEYRQDFRNALPQYGDDVMRLIDSSEKTIRPTEYAETWTKYLKSQGYHLYVLSNYCEDTLRKTKPLMTFLKNMDGVVFSCEVKQIKPEPEIYHTLLDRYALVPEQSVFIDDREENCEAARALGIHAIRFESFKQAAAELEKLGVK